MRVRLAPSASGGSRALGKSFVRLAYLKHLCVIVKVFVLVFFFFLEKLYTDYFGYACTRLSLISRALVASGKITQVGVT